MKAETFFTEAERQQITAAIHEVEGRTAGEIAVVVVAQCDDYPEGRLIAGVFAGLLAAFAATDACTALFPELSLFRTGPLPVFVVSSLVLVTLFGWLAGFLPLVKRLFVADDRLEKRVQARALAAFFEKGLYKTRDESGVLFFLSLFERKVHVLADRGIYAKIPPQTLESYAGDIALGVKNGKAAEALCRQIRAAGEVLAVHFPIRPDDVNELPDEVMTGS